MNKLVSAILTLALAAGMRAAPADDDAAVRRLNDDYVRAFLASDVARYRELLAEDFMAVLADGRLIDRAEFLRQAAQPPGAADFHLGDVQVRLYGDAAIVGGRVSYRRPDRTLIQTRYVDVCVRRAGTWRIVSAQFTRISPPPGH
jgi:ketosteroid isomerase-like protein